MAKFLWLISALLVSTTGGRELWSSGSRLQDTQDGTPSRSLPHSSGSIGQMSPDSSAQTPATLGSPAPDHPHQLAVFTVELERVETPIMIGLWIFLASLAKIGFHMAPRFSHIFPESCLLIAVGAAIGLLLFFFSSLHVSPLTPDTFFLYMLPPIILDAGYFMPNRLFFDHLGTILMFAVVGTVFNALTIGLCLYGVGLTGLYGVETPLLDILLFSTLISAVDPVAVLAVFEEIHVNEILYIVVFGESLLNDAVTVVLYHMFEAYSSIGLSNIGYTDLGRGLMSFIVVAAGGTLIGMIWGFLTGLVTRFTDEVRVIEPIFIFVMAYLAYLNAELFHMSGILAITFCGITMKNYVEANISHKSHTTIKYAMKMLSSSSETVIFMFLGVSTVSDKHDWNTWFVLLTITFCSIFRVLGVILLTAVVNKFRLVKLDKVDKFVMSYGGLRGAVAFALVLLIDQDRVKLRPMFVTTTIAVIYFTVFIQGITIKPLVNILNVKRAEKRKPTMNERIHERVMDHLMAGIEDILGRHGNHHVRDKFRRFDNKFIRPLLTREQGGAEPKILETYSKLAMKDAIEYMRRNASVMGNISNTESMSAIFRNYTTSNLEGSFSQLDPASNWNIDLQELEYNPSRKDLTDARIHHLLAEELCQPYRRHRRLSYSRHAVNDKDLTTQVNYRLPMNIRRMGGGSGRHHHKRSKRMKDGKQNHVSFPGVQQNGSAKQFSHDYIDEVLQEEDTERDPKDDWDAEGGITFTAHPPRGGMVSPVRSSSGYSLLTCGHPGPTHHPTVTTRPRLVRQATRACRPESPDTPPPATAAESSLPWRRPDDDTGPPDSPTSKKTNRDSTGSDNTRVNTPTALEKMLPWKRGEDDNLLDSGPVKQSEFPSWCTNKEYLAYNSPSSTFLGNLGQVTRKSVIGLFRRESECSTRSGTPSPPPGPPPKGGSASSVLLMEEGAALLPKDERRAKPPPPQPRRGSMLELQTSHLLVDPIQEEELLMVCEDETPPKFSERPVKTRHRLTKRQSSLPAQVGPSHPPSHGKPTESFESSEGEAEHHAD